MTHKKLESYFFNGLYLGMLVLVGYLFLPYLGALVVALVLAALMQPVYGYVLRVVKSEMAAGILTVFATMVVIMGPATLIIYLVVGEVSTIREAVPLTERGVFLTKLAPIEAYLNNVNPLPISIDFESILREAIRAISQNIGTAFSSTASVILKVFISLIALYYILTEGKLYKQILIKYSPLRDVEDALVLEKLDFVTHSLIRGRLIIALLQGMLTAIGFVLFGLPNPVLWGSVAAITAILPTIGTAFVTVPAFLFLMFSGSYIAALLFAAYGLIVIGLSDNLLMPRLVGHGKGVEIHPLLILLSVLGGIGVFGAAGFLIGPLVLAFAIALTHIYATKTGVQE